MKRAARSRFPGAFLSLLVLTGAGGAANADGQTALTIPAGTQITFHVDAPISSNGSKTGQRFSFELLQPIALADRSIPLQGTTGSGTISLAGHAGTSGHEGDLTLRLDRLKTQDGRTYTFDDQQLKIDGRNRKVASGVLGFVPFVGIGARFIRGSDVRVETTRPIETVLTRPATSAAITPDAAANP